jgi:HEAT repeat protein
VLHWFRVGIALLLALLAVSIAFADEITSNFNGKSLAEWKKQTQPQFKFLQRVEAINALAEIAQIQIGRYHPQSEQISWVEREIVPTMIELFHDKTSAIRQRAIESFRRFPKAGKKAIKPLIVLLDDEDDKVRIVASESLIIIDPDEIKRVLPVLSEIISKGKPGSGFAANALADMKQPEGRKVLIKFLDHQDPVVREVAIKALKWGNKSGLSIAEIEKYLRNDNAKIRADAVFIVSDIRPTTKEAVLAIMPLLKDPDFWVRDAVWIGLSNMHADPKLVSAEMIKLKLIDENGYVRSAPVKLLWVLGPTAIPSLRRSLASSSPGIRADAASALGNIGPAAKDAVPALKELLTDMHKVGDDDYRVCHYAGEALAKILKNPAFQGGLPPVGGM